MGNPVSIKDMFRLGKYRKSSDTSSRVHVRPILVKMSTAWERKLLRKSKLCDFRTKHLFVRDDVPPEHKLRQRRPKSRAESTVTSMPSTSNIPPHFPVQMILILAHIHPHLQHRVFLLQVHRSLLPHIVLRPSLNLALYLCHPCTLPALLPMWIPQTVPPQWLFRIL